MDSELQTPGKGSAAEIPFPYVVGQRLELKTPDDKQIKAVITHIYPITVSPVMKVQIETAEGGMVAILKLYDRRFGDLREEHPYNQGAENVWQDCVRSGLAEKLVGSLQEEDDMRIKARFRVEGDEQKNGDINDEDDGNEDESDEEDDPREDEAYIYYMARTFYHAELRAYNQLAAVQGRYIPRLIDSIIETPASTPPDLPAIYFQVPGILLEYIDGYPLTDLTVRLPDQPKLWESIVRDAIQVAREINNDGVVHLDCQPRNVLVAEVTPGVFRPYFIDFGQCAFRDDYKKTMDVFDEDGFPYILHLKDNHGAIAVLMTNRIARTTPYKIQVL